VHEKISATVGLVIRTVEWVLKTHKYEQNGYINIILVDNKKIIELNAQYLRKNEPTDVLAFNLSENKQNFFEGEIYISLDRTVEQAKEYGVTFEQELIRLVSHGVLHLLGYKDDTPEGKKRMSTLEDAAVEKIEKFKEV